MRKNKYYFQQIVDLSEYLIKAFDTLDRIYHEFQYENMQYLILEMHEIENEADTIVHRLKKSLSDDFLMPRSRVDMSHLAEVLDSVVDKIEDVTQSFYMYNITSFRPETEEFLNIIGKCVQEIHQMILHLQKSSRLTSLEPHIQQIYDLEDQADQLYLQATKNLFEEEDDPIVLTQWEEIIFMLERCCDKCKSCADDVLRIHQKY